MVILNIISLKKVYNDEIILELFIKNKNFSCLVLIDENESFDIDFIVQKGQRDLSQILQKTY